MIRRARVYLRGAYGPGNLGDDVLLFCMIKILKRVFEGKEITVSVNDIDAARSLDGSLSWVPLNSPIFTDITVLGGGGQFFSFAKNSNKPLVKYNFWHKIGNLYKKKYTISDVIIGIFLRKLYGIGYKSKKIATFCIGVGPFENKRDYEYIRAFNILSRADYISVRDAKSKHQVVEMCNREPLQFCDITLNRSLWFSGPRSLYQNISDKPVVGMILRDWKLSSFGFDIINKLLDFEYNHEEYNYVYISFHKTYDQVIFDKLKGKTTIIWDPGKFSINSYIQQIKQTCNVVVSTRAHGVLLPAMSYIPIIAIEIEQKLRAVHEMMPLSTKLVSGAELDKLPDYIDLCLNYGDDFLRKVDEDIESISEIAQGSIDSLEKWLIHAKE